MIDRCLNRSTESDELDHLHVVDEGVAVGPGRLAGALQRFLSNLLYLGQLVQRQSEGVNRVVDEGCGGVQVSGWDCHVGHVLGVVLTSSHNGNIHLVITLSTMLSTIP